MDRTRKPTPLLRRASLFIGAVAACCSTTALAWGSEGHQYVGNLAWALLNPNARAHVRALLGPDITLGQAATWPDCARSVEGSPATGYRYTADPMTPKVCDAFGSRPAEVQRMIDYASRNWTNCEYAGHMTKCNLSYHFADVNVHEHSDYRFDYFGAHPFDVVQAINAAELILRCKTGQTCTSPTPFNIADKREALLLLAHFVGDVHQPLHVGAIYLDTANTETGDAGASTIGGNFLLLSPGSKSNNLHHSWDQISSSLGITPSASAISNACQIAPLPNPVADPPEKWASESVVAAQAAYAGMTFRRDQTLPNYWDVQLADPGAYSSLRRSLQAQRLVGGGARLAEVLNSIWPSKKRATACKGVT